MKNAGDLKWEMSNDLSDIFMNRHSTSAPPYMGSVAL